MFDFFKLLGLFEKSPAAPAPQKDELDLQLEVAKTAWSLPADYFDKNITGGDFDVYAPRGVDGLLVSQSPLHRIMCGGHTSIPESVRERLWASYEYRRCVAHVFVNMTSAELRRQANGLVNHGYWNPMALTMLRACDEGLVGVDERSDVLGALRLATLVPAE